MKKIAVLPTLLTLGNGVCGFAAIVCASKIGRNDVAGEAADYFALSGWLILAAMVFDALDGYVARLTKTASKFGGELDSLCDCISFGAAPAYLLLHLGPRGDAMARLLPAIAVLYMVCTILRLARFNVNSNIPDPAAHKRFQGLPSPGAAGCLASLAILRGELPAKLAQYWPDADATALATSVQVIVESWAMLGAVVVALLMVSAVPYPHVTKNILRGKRHFGHLMQVILASFVILLMRELAIVLLFWVYALGLPVNYAISRQLARRRARVPRAVGS
ncbi:MAG TPA: CDP-diacylglycerol--serine O-phosphatidyltransferase [Gemmataceae bacterium]|nr:CDP-diacylglycerol--serine O-phosphatidyltransferase [Gemmataceae bacterium]